MGTTSIEWTEKTWNPLRGCSPVSPGCKNCYAERIAARFSGPGQPFEGFAKWRTKSGVQRDIAHEDLKLWAPGEREPAWTGKTALIPSKLTEPLSWASPTRVFVNSMSDLFHEGFTFAEIATVFAIMAIGRHTYQVLTKRIDRALEFFEWMEKRDEPLGKLGDLYGLHVSPMRMPEEVWDDDRTNADDDLEAIYDAEWPLDNVWIGASVENQKYADLRLPVLEKVPAAKRFVSYEPALGNVSLKRWLHEVCADCGRDTHDDGRCQGSRIHAIDWVIVGGESGHGARAFDIGWARNVVEECKAAHIPVFVKQLGARPYYDLPLSMVFRGGVVPTTTRIDVDLKSKKGGDIEEWPVDLRIREFPS
ncbi:MAG: DUF5131 family protein [Vicinamibacteria bacterium]